MNTFLFISKVAPPLVVVVTFLFTCASQASDLDPHSEFSAPRADGEAFEGQAPKRLPIANEEPSHYKKYHLGKGRFLFVNTTKSFESYDNWLIDPSSFEFSKRQRALGKRDKRRLQEMLLQARVKQTESFGGMVVSAGSPCTLKQRLHLKNLKLKSHQGGGSQVNFSRSYGQATIVAEIRDSMSDDVVFIYKEKIALGGGVSGGGGARIDLLAKAIRLVMNNAHKILVHALPLSEERIAARSEFGCLGKLGQNAVSLREAREQMANQ